ncbi:MAG: hypothetical protein ACI8U1_001308, partial [Rheinheimera aquimaris]
SSWREAVNLETRLPSHVWEAVRANYEKRNFTGAILDAFYFLSELLRNKSGTEGDGASLIGLALGGTVPKIKLNRLQTESELSVQRGMEQLLRGLYQSVRNPRSHDKVVDSEDDAQTLILFVGYVVKQIDQAKAQFSRSDFVRRVLDPDFVPQERYAELLVLDIPPRARFDVFLDLYRENEEWKAENMRLFLKALFETLNEDDIQKISEVVTEDLKTCDAESTIRAVLGSFPPSLWPQVGEAARLRVENKIIRSVRDGRYENASEQCRSGALGTWSTHIFAVMTLKDEMLGVIASKIWSRSSEERAYVFRYLFNNLPDLSPMVPERIASALCSRLNAGDVEVHGLLGFLPPWDEVNWPEKLKNAYSSFKTAEPVKDSDNEIPF